MVKFTSSKNQRNSSSPPGGSKRPAFLLLLFPRWYVLTGRADYLNQPLTIFQLIFGYNKMRLGAGIRWPGPAFGVHQAAGLSNFYKQCVITNECHHRISTINSIFTKHFPATNIAGLSYLVSNEIDRFLRRGHSPGVQPLGAAPGKPAAGFWINVGQLSGILLTAREIGDFGDLVGLIYPQASGFGNW